MPKLSPAREGVPVLEGLELLNRGKVRDTYKIDNNYALAVTTNGLSIFDFVVNALVPEKGAILNALSHFWLTKLQEELNIRTHLVATGAAIDPFLPKHLRGNPDLQARATVVVRLDMVDVEFVVRGFLTGSGLKDYKKTSRVCGHILPDGLQDGDQLDPVLDTPTTKAKEGNDEPLDAMEIRKKHPKETELMFTVYDFGRTYAASCGVIPADTKFEMGYRSGKLHLGDEVLTPDSSRFWDYAVWASGRKAITRKAPPPYDKQHVRAWGIEQGIDKLDAKLAADIAKVHGMMVPQHLIAATTEIYRYIFWRLTGKSLETYQRHVLGIEVEQKKRQIAIVFGSDTDIPKVPGALRKLSHSYFSEAFTRVDVHVISCHRNPNELVDWVKRGCGGADVIIAVGSKALALPGVLDAWIHHSDRDIPVIGVILGEGTALEAARLSISELPSLPVVMNEVTGTVYEGELGLYAALERAAYGELPPRKVRTEKPALWNVDLSKYI